MGHVIDTDGALLTELNNTLLTQTDTQVAGFEQFVSATDIKIVEELPSYTNYVQEFVHALPIMTDNGHPTGNVFSDLTGSERINAYKVFSRDTSTSVRWEDTKGWVKYDALAPMFIARYVVTTPYSGNVDSLPYSWKVLGSNDDRNWVVIDSRYYKTLELGRRYAFDCIAPHSFRYIKFEWTETLGTLGYSVLGTIDYYNVKSLGFEEHFDSNMPIIEVDTEHNEKLTHFHSVRRNRDYKFDADPFGDDSQLCYFPFNGNLDDVTGKQTLTASYNPIYVDLGDGTKGLDYMNYSTDQYMRTDNKLPLTGKEGLTVCAWVQISIINYPQWVNIWQISPDDSNTLRPQTVWLYTGNTSVIHSHTSTSGISITKDSKKVMKPNKWQFVVMRQTQNSYEVLVDGKIIDGATTNKTTNFLDDGYLYIGSRWYYKAHLIRDFRAFDRHLSDEELFTLQASGKTIASLRDNKMPLAFTIFDSDYKLNDKKIPTTIESLEVVKTRKKYRYVDYRMFGGSSINNYSHIDEVDVQDEQGNSLAIGKPVVAHYTGNGNKDAIVDGVHNNSSYYSSNNSNAYIRIDLGNPEDIKYIQNWNYFQDNRYYKDIRITLTNSPTYDYDEAYDLVFKTEYSGRYQETANGRISTNLNFEYTFKVEYSCKEVYYPAEYTLNTSIFFPRKGTKLHEISCTINRNLWHVKPRMLKSVNELMDIEDRGHLLTPRTKVVTDVLNVLDIAKESNPPFTSQSEDEVVTDIPVHILTAGTINTSLEQSKQFELVMPIIAGVGNTYNVISKSITENMYVTDFTIKYIRYNVCGQDVGTREAPMEYLKLAENIFFFKNMYPNKGVQVVSTGEVITNIVTVGTVGDNTVEDVTLHETALAAIDIARDNTVEDVTLHETALAAIDIARDNTVEDVTLQETALAIIA